MTNVKRAGTFDELTRSVIDIDARLDLLETTGFTGSGGNGYTGSQGNVGFTGSRGATGFTGSAGANGAAVNELILSTGAIDEFGTVNFYSLDSSQNYTSYTDGLRLNFRAHADSSYNAKINVDGISDINGLVYKDLGYYSPGNGILPVGPGTIALNGIYDIVYSSLGDLFVVLNPTILISLADSFDFGNVQYAVTQNATSGTPIGEPGIITTAPLYYGSNSIRVENNGDFTIEAGPVPDRSYTMNIIVTNSGETPGTISLSGFTKVFNSGILTDTNGDAFLIKVTAHDSVVIADIQKIAP